MVFLLGRGLKDVARKFGELRKQFYVLIFSLMLYKSSPCIYKELDLCKL